MFLHRLLVLTALFFAAVSPSQAAGQDVGVVLMHGKWDRPPTHVQGLARELEAAGYRVVTPTMPWAGSREYDVPYPQALAEIESAVRSLRDQGARHVIVGGISFGGNAALAYAASGRPVDAIFVLSPGHTPDRGAFRNAVEPSVSRARSMVESGAGKESARFEDRNQGRARQVRATAESYLSYFDPDGSGAMPRSAASIPQALPLFMASGSNDPLSAVARESIFDRAPKHDKSLYTIIAAGHTGITTVIGPALISWIRTLGF